MHAKELQRYKKLLVEKRQELQTPSAGTGTVIPGAGGIKGDFLDQASADAEAELQIQLHRTDGRLLRAIEEAFDRIREGTYGMCEVCKQPISKARLEAVPWTRHCRECKEREHV
jgi:DnaK suppressor protein